MGTVFGKNTTSASITVAGHKVYYIDSTDAEIVEVERAQPAHIDLWLYLSGTGSAETKTFSANDYWNSRVIDSTDEQALRDFGVSLVNIGGDPIVYGINSSNSDFSFAPLGLYSGLRTGDLNADMSNFYVADGGSTWSNRKCIWSRSAYSTPALTWKCRITKNSGGTSKYNAFKYLLSGTPYWYVIDGEHDTWTDDLSAWGYSEVQPVETLPTVTTEGDFASYNWLRVSSAESVSGGGNTSNLTTDGTDYPDYNTDNSYATLQWQQSGGTTSGRVEFSIVNANGKIQAHNNTSGALTFYQARVAVCSSNQATVVTVYDSSNVSYNAFKFTASGTDYYYVLDGTQTDWTNDLSSIGYSLTPAILMAYLTSTTPHSDKYLNEYNTYSIVDSNNNAIPYDSTKTYTKLGTYRVDGTSVSSNTSLVESNGYLKLYNSTPRVEVGYVEYTVS